MEWPMKNCHFAKLTMSAILVLGISLSLAGCGGSNSKNSGGNGDPSNSGAAVTGNYRNLFKENGKTDAEIDAKVKAAWESLFSGKADECSVYFETGDMAYIKDIGNGDVRSEGMSYGMMIAVQMGDQDKFNKLWRWAKKYMYYDSGVYKGYFAWQCTDAGEKIQNGGSLPSPASDGEEYFVTALIFANKVWGSQGDVNYSDEAQTLLTNLLHQKDDGEGVNIFDTTQNQVVFCPIGDSATFTDPSYHLPAFYEIWAKFSANDEDRAKWSAIAATSRAFFAKTVHPTTGLAPDYANFDGSPRAVDGHENFKYDAFRTVSNAAVDYAWWQKDAFAQTYAERLQNFFIQKTDSTTGAYNALWALDGTELTGTHGAGAGLIGMNAVASLASSNEEVRKKFVEALWNLSAPTGQWRYYDGMLYMMAMLHCSGKFKAYY